MSGSCLNLLRAFIAYAVGYKIKIIGLKAGRKGRWGNHHTVDTHGFLAADAVEMQVFVVVFEFAALVVAQGIFHAAAVVGHLMQQAFFGKSVEGAVQGYPVVFVHQGMFQLGLGDGPRVVDDEIEHVDAGVGQTQFVRFKQRKRSFAHFAALRSLSISSKAPMLTNQLTPASNPQKTSISV